MVEVYTPQVGASEVIGSAVIKSVEDLQKQQNWDFAFRSGEQGIAVYRFPIPLPNDLPNWMAIPWWTDGKYTPIEASKQGIAEYVEGRLKAQGVVMLTKPKWFGNELFVYFKTGLPVLFILAIVVGVLIAIGVLTITISLYKLKKAQVDAQAEAVVQRQEGALEIISGIEDEGLRSEALKEYLEGTKPEETGLKFDLGLEKPIFVFAILVGVAVIVYAFMKGGV